MKNFKYLLLSLSLVSLLLITGCDDDDEPAIENEEEFISTVTLTFTPINGGDAVTGSALDPDGEGPQDIQVSGPIVLAQNTAYELSIDLLSGSEVLTTEIQAEDEDHMFFFGFTDALFLSPDGDGNIDNRGDFVDYLDFDSNGNPLGLRTSWTTEDAPASGTFRVVLKHQPGTKSATSDVDTGSTDLDLTWPLEVQ